MILVDQLIAEGTSVTVIDNFSSGHAENLADARKSSKLRFIEVKGRVTGADTITVTKNEILYSLNKPEDFILAIVEFIGEDNHQVHYVRRPFHNKGITTEFAGATVNFPFPQLIAEGLPPA